jgi:hypothetical protein
MRMPNYLKIIEVKSYNLFFFVPGMSRRGMFTRGRTVRRLAVAGRDNSARNEGGANGTTTNGGQIIDNLLAMKDRKYNRKYTYVHIYDIQSSTFHWSMQSTS